MTSKPSLYLPGNWRFYYEDIQNLLFRHSVPSSLPLVEDLAVLSAEAYARGRDTEKTYANMVAKMREER